MKKGNKKFLVVAILLLLVGLTTGTYAIYKVSKSGNATLTTAAWSVKLNGSNLEDSTTIAIPAANINWTKNPGKNGTIAPGATGTITFEIDATGSEVDVDYDITTEGAKIGTNAIATAAGFTVTGASASGTINYSTTANAMKKTVTVNVVWTGSDSDNDAKNTADKAIAGQTVSIPFTITAKQHIAD